MRPSRTPISSADRAILEHLETHLAAVADDEPVTRESAVTYLTEHGVDRIEARARIEQLLLKGYLYEVSDERRIPPGR